MTKKGRQFFPWKIGSAAPVEGPQQFFWTGPAESNYGPGNKYVRLLFVAQNVNQDWLKKDLWLKTLNS